MIARRADLKRMLAGALGLLLVSALLSSCTNSRPSTAFDTACPREGRCALVLNGNGIYGINLGNYRVDRIVETSNHSSLSSSEIRPVATELAVDWPKKEAYVVSQSSIYPIDLQDGLMKDPILVTHRSIDAAGLDLSRTSNYLYIGGSVQEPSGGNVPRFKMWKVSLSDDKVVRRYSVNGAVDLLSLGVGDKDAYLAVENGAGIGKFNLSTGILSNEFLVPNGAGTMDVAIAANEGYVGGSRVENIGGVTYSFVTQVDLAHDTVGSTISLRNGPSGIAVTREGRTAYVTNGVDVGPPVPPAVSVVDLEHGSVVRTIRVPGGAGAISTPDGSAP